MKRIVAALAVFFALSASAFADTKISGLPTAPPLAQTDTTIVVKNGVTYQAPISQLTSGLVINGSNISAGSVGQSAVTNGYVDLSSPQTINGLKTFGNILSDAAGFTSGSSTYGPTNATIAGSGDALQFTNTTSADILFVSNGAAPPSFNTRSIGTKLALYNALSSSSADYAIGIDNGVLWNSIANSAANFKWYAGTTPIATLDGAGNLSVNGSFGTTNGTISPQGGFGAQTLRSLFGSDANYNYWESVNSANTASANAFIGGHSATNVPQLYVGATVSQFNGHIGQIATGQIAGTATLAAGTVTVTFPTAYGAPPVVVATGTSTANAMKVSTTATQAVITSSSGTDTQVVNYIVVGNPN